MINELFKTERVRIGDLVPHAKNPRKIKAVEKQKLWERLTQYGMIGIPVRDADGTLLSGNRRCELFADNGLADYEVDVRTAVRKLTDEELRQVMIIENSHAGEWDLQLLKDEFSHFLDLDDFGISLAELDRDLEEQTRRLTDGPELPIVPKMSEQYRAFVIVATNEIDANNVAERLGLGDGKCYKSSKAGIARVITAHQFNERWNSKS